MTRKRISQAAAKRLQRRVIELVGERNELLSRRGWVCPGTPVTTIHVGVGEDRGRIDMAQRLGYTLFAKIEGDRLNIWAVRP